MAGSQLFQEMSRLRDWAERLDALVCGRLHEPFEWGRNDCCLFAADAVLACTGTDLAEGLRGSYGDAAGAARLLRRFGGVAGLAEKSAGTEIEPVMAQCGDIGLAVIDGRDTLAVCAGPHWYAPGEHGLALLVLEQVSRAWRLPCRRQ